MLSKGKKGGKLFKEGNYFRTDTIQEYMGNIQAIAHPYLCGNSLIKVCELIIINLEDKNPKNGLGQSLLHHAAEKGKLL